VLRGSNDRRPLIGISASFHDFGDYGGVGIQRPLLRAGGLPMTLPQLPEAIDDSLDRLDAVVLAPGRDIDPARYGQAPDPLLAPTEPQRDEFELALVPSALERGLPVLGVCRGMQVLNVALGGTLFQDVRLSEPFRTHPSDPGWKAWKQMEGTALSGEEVPPHPRHPIEVAQPSLLFDALGTAELSVNSFHHQAVDTLGDGLRATALAPDGVFEAIELDGRDVLGVQWELQEEWRVDLRFSRVFTWFVSVAAGAARGARLESGGVAAEQRNGLADVHGRPAGGSVVTVLHLHELLM
jgi:putative glutamine amidotransferase